MNILAIDYGQKITGLAWMQEGLDVVLPFGVIENKKGVDFVSEIKKLVEEEGIHKIVVGLPLTLDSGEENAHTKRIRKVVEELKEKIKLPVVLVDERLSSSEADDMGGDASRDEKAAMVILMNYKSGMGIIED